MFENFDICGACGGICCKALPGCTYPEDFGLPATDRLAAALSSGRWAIDWWEGDPRPEMHALDRAHFVRPAIKGSELRIRHPAYYGECTFLGATGCELAPDARPRQCRYLEPAADGDCVPHAGGKREAALAWLPCAEALARVEDQIKSRDEEE